MPTIAYFLGIAVRMYYHDPPHVHVMYQGHEALVAIGDARVIQGKLPPTALLIARRWIVLRRKELANDWKLAKARLPLERIAGPDEAAD
jgi:hypothetical protein